MKKRWLIPLAVLFVALLCVSALAQEQAEWTVLWYLCGTDLETNDGAATYNLEEAMAGNTNDEVNVIVVTGGTVEWQNNYIPNNAVGLFRLNGRGGLTELDRLPDGNMASEELLSSMIQTVFTAYPAKHTMLILWDHGGGSVGGVAFDERTDDSISLSELQQALAQGGVTFDIIGFDACLMASLEIANVLSPYAAYMIASQDLEPGGGWDYRGMMQEFSKNPAITPAELGVSICDDYLAHCIAWEDSEIATLSLVNLSKIPALVEAFDTLSVQLTAVAETPAAIQSFRQEASKARNFGGNNRSEGYTHMIDLGEMVLNTEGVWDEVGLAVLDCLFDAVEYSIDGNPYKKANGLSVFYPFTTDADVSYACQEVAQVPVSTAYMRFVSALVPAWNTYGAFADTTQETADLGWTQADTQTTAVSSTQAETSGGTGSSGSNTQQIGHTQDSYIGQQWVVPSAQADAYDVSFSTMIDDYGYYVLYVDTGLDYIEEVQFALYMIDDDWETAVLLGTDNDIDAYWDEGIFFDNFRGVWLTIDGEYCSPILIDAQDDYNLYTIPIELNGERTNLRAQYVVESWDEDGVTGYYEAIGVWDGIDSQTGISARDITPLQQGDVILPLFDAYPLDDISSGSEEWSTYEIVAGTNGEVTLEELDLFDGTYYYTFILTDIYGKTYESDGVYLYMEGDEFYFEEID